MFIHAGEVCSISGEWLNVTGVHSAGGSLLSQFYTLPLCLTACRDLLDNCVGVDVDSRLHDEIRCWVHNNATDFDETYHSTGLAQYRLRTLCAQPGKTGGWLRGTVVERGSVTGKLSLSYTLDLQPISDH